MNRRAIPWGLGLIGIAVVSWWHGGAPAPRAAAPTGKAAELWIGTASCSGRGCHGAPGPVGDKGGEFTTWLYHDPHTRAATALTDGEPGERSRRMVQLLRPKDPQARPETDSLCLSCHAPEAQARGDKTLSALSFGCESCHGPARDWREPHATKEWQTRDEADKRRLHFEPMLRLEDRVRVCARCHIGEGERDVNHDLIAAGHPRLRFEFFTYQANLRPWHWSKENDGDLAKAWVVGQLVSAEADLLLLADRAESKTKPWPEFAAYDCFACHHDLKPGIERQKQGFGDRVPGTLPWNHWYESMPSALTSVAPLTDAELRVGIEQLGKLMERPLPPRAAVAEQARKSAAGMRQLLTADAAKLRKPPSTWLAKLPLATWDEAAQRALALSAEMSAEHLRQIVPRDDARDKEVQKLFRLLRFADSPGRDSPERFDAPDFAEQLRQTCERFGKPK